MTAMICAGAVTSQFVAGKATRDALFLAQLDFTSLPAMLMGTSAVSVVLALANSRAGRRFSPARFVPLCFGVSSLLFVAEWLLLFRAPAIAAVLVYLHISGAGPLLVSGFWLIASERFDPRTAKRRFGQISGAGTLGGLVSAVIAERVASTLGIGSMLPVLAALHLFSGWQVRRLAVCGQAPLSLSRADRRVPSTSVRQLLRRAPYLRDMGLLVLLGTTGATLLDYLFKAEAVGTIGRGDNLLRFFAAYYAGTSLVTFVVQTSFSRYALERYGLAWTASTPSVAVILGALGSLVAPGFAAIGIARASESVLRGSLYRSGYELFYTPMPPVEKRSAKSIIDVACDRVGDAVGGAVVRIVLLAPAGHWAGIVSLAMACAAMALFAASRLNRGYIQTLEKSLLNRAVELELGDVRDGTTRTLVVRTLYAARNDLAALRPSKVPGAARGGPSTSAVALDREVQQTIALRSRDRDRILHVLRAEECLSQALTAHVLPLLAWDAIAPDVIVALRKVAEERLGQLVDALIDPNQEFTVRRRLARVFSVCVSQRAADGVMLGLDDQRFEVRYHCARSLSAIVEKNPLVRVDRDRVLAIVLREAAVGGLIWESRRLLDDAHAADGVSFVDDFVRDRANQSLAHVFTLLALILPREPLQIAFRSLHTDDRQLRGTALEYLETVLPSAVRDRLWPYLEDRRPKSHRSVQRPKEEVLADLLGSHESVMLSLQELKRRARSGV